MDKTVEITRRRNCLDHNTHLHHIYHKMGFNALYNSGIIRGRMGLRHSIREHDPWIQHYLEHPYFTNQPKDYDQGNHNKMVTNV